MTAKEPSTWTEKHLKLIKNFNKIIGEFGILVNYYFIKSKNFTNPNNPMIIGGLQKLSLLDYPGYIAAIIFTQGCNFHCQFCYNPMLVWPASREGSKLKYKAPSNDWGQEGHSGISEDDLFVFLKKRTGKLDAVVITGGEPTIQSDLSEFIEKIRALGYKIKLDTNGTNSTMLKKLLEKKLIDYIAMDIKAPAEKYEEVTGVKANLEEIKKSINLIINSGLPYEFRTTLVPGLHRPEDIAGIGKLIQGASLWYLQQFKSDTDLINKKFEGIKAYTKIDLEKMREIGEGFVKKCEIR